MSPFCFSPTHVTIWLLLTGISVLHHASAASLLLEALKPSNLHSEQLLPKSELKIFQNNGNNIGAVNSMSYEKRASDDVEIPDLKTDDVMIQDWPSNAINFPNVWNQKNDCNRPGGTYYDNWICDPDGILTIPQTNVLNDLVNEILSCTRCACDNRNQCRDSPAPYGSYSIGVAIVGNLTSSGGSSPLEQQFTDALRDTRWTNIQQCFDGIFMTLNIGGRTRHTSTSAKAREALSDNTITEIEAKVVQYLQRDDWFNYLNEKLKLIKAELPGCGGGGLSAGQIAGIVIGCILGVAFIVSLILCCVGFCQNWECVVGTCAGVCIGALLSAFQRAINAMIFNCVKNMCDSMGCGGCCADCEPFSCVDEDSGAGGGGGDF